MPYAIAAKNSMLDALPGTQNVSLHTSYSTTGANEVAGGSYARQSLTLAAAASGARDSSNTPQFTLPTVSGVKFVGFWNPTGPVFLGMAPLGGGTPVPFTVDDVAADTLEAPAHGFANGDQVTVWQLAGLALPTGLTEGDVYFVVGATTDDLQLSLTSGGAAINLTAIGRGLLQKITPRDFQADDTLTLTDADLDLNL